MDVLTARGDRYEDASFEALQPPWLMFRDEDGEHTVVRDEDVLELTFTDPDEFERFRAAAVNNNALKVWTS